MTNYLKPQAQKEQQTDNKFLQFLVLKFLEEFVICTFFNLYQTSYIYRIPRTSECKTCESEPPQAFSENFHIYHM